MATVAGNFVNASPIGDLSILFLALDANLVLARGDNRREIPFRTFFKEYKKTALSAGEQIEQIWFEIPSEDSMLNFEKVSKRQHLDIATVNTAINISFTNNKIANAAIAAGGVGPIPFYLEKTSRFLKGKDISEETVLEAVKLAGKEISPISDARGSKEYKAFLLSQLIKAHFIAVFPELKAEKLLIPS
jgi:xanthine dehydrogenase small subunit